MSALPLGQIIYIAVKPIFKIYLIIGVGFLLARKNILTVETSKNLSAIAIQVLIPCLAFELIVSNIRNSDIAEIGTIVIVAVFLIGTGAMLCFGLGVLAGCPRIWWGGLISCGILPNISDLPIAYLQTMEGSNVFNNIDMGVSYVMIFMTIQMLVQFNFGAYKLIETDFKTELRLRARDKEASVESGINNEQIHPEEEFTDTRTRLNVKDDGNSNDECTSSINSDSQVDEENNSESLSSNSSLSEVNTEQGRQALPYEDSQEQLRPVSTKNSALNNLSRQTTSRSILTHIPTLNSLLEPVTRTVSVPQHIFDNDRIRQKQQHETTEDIVRVYSRFADLQQQQTFEPSTINKVEKSIAVSESRIQVFLSHIKSLPTFLASIQYKKRFKSMLDIWVAATLKIVSITLILSIIICMIPWLQALFVVTPQASVPTAPDKLPPLSFIIDFTSYIGAAEVPVGLLLLGGTIGRLKLNKLPDGLWKVPLAVVLSRLFIQPVVGCAFNSKLWRDGLFYDEKILYFVCNINFCLPPATSLIYITAFYTPVRDPDDEGESIGQLQMDCLALVYIANYIFLVVCLPFVTTYTMKVSLGF
ncbi:hypothetical protein DAMA08_039880 [Martiniozyma asiatica (nom. inval.)]|nr:hypothetical protein DAMA08_039880 [Martiniozyma asiatica]